MENCEKTVNTVNIVNKIVIIQRVFNKIFNITRKECFYDRRRCVGSRKGAG